MKNLLQNIPDTLPEELFEILVSTENIQIERIVSRGHTTPSGAWYDQDRNEFVLVLKGAGHIEFGNGRTESLEAGDWLEIPARMKHRVVWTDPENDTIWLAVHYS